MRSFKWPFIVVCTLLATPLPAQEVESPSKEDYSLDQLRWLVGSWSGGQGNPGTEEHWIEPKGQMMLGLNRTVRGSRKAAFEFLRIEQNGSEIVYLASPGGRAPPTPFKLVKLTDDEAVFENPEHDFPQRIGYKRVGEKLHGRIEGEVNGQQRSVQWTWQREK